MSGEEEFRTAQQRMQEVDDAIASYEEKIGIDKLTGVGEAENYLNLSGDVLSKFSDEQCGIGAYVLSRYAGFLQKQYNLEKRRENWADANLKVAIADQLGDYAYCSFEDKLLRAVKDNEYAMKLYKIKVYAEQRATQLFLISSNVQAMSKTLIELQQTKRRYSH